MAKNKKANPPILNIDEKAECYVVIEGARHIPARPGVAVYDNRGKRRIGKRSKVQICFMDKVVYGEEEYRVKNFTDTHVILQKIQ